MNNADTAAKALDIATSTATAFRTYTELCDACDRGYTPTLQPVPQKFCRTAKHAAHNDAILTVRHRLEADGYEVFPAELP